jgi:hypothetical protein
MKIFRMTMIAAMALLFGAGLVSSCSDANEYEDSRTDNPTWGTAGHPESLANTSWVRAKDMKRNAFGEQVQGFVESLNFVTADSVSVKMSQGTTAGTWTDESNNERTPFYEYTYSATTGRVEILKLVMDEKKNISKSAVFVGIATTGSKDVLTVVHYGDTPVQTYLVRQ